MRIAPETTSAGTFCFQTEYIRGMPIPIAYSTSTLAKGRIRQSRVPWGGLGLLNIKARTELSGGIFAVESAKGKGTAVRASWPLNMGA
jgi:hypothetical protein